MPFYLKNKNILLGMTGSIAAYKSADLVRRLREEGANVIVGMTENAKKFITPLTMQALSGNPIHDDLFDLRAESAMGHIELSRWADLILIAPASADFIARMATGQANDLLTSLTLATKACIAIAPAMNQGMWHHPLTHDNIQKLKDKQIQILGPVEGSQACGDIGLGRMMEPTEILTKLKQHFSKQALAGVRMLITAGPTREPIDPIRYISNRSSGKMGYALAQAAWEAGADITMVSGPVSIPKPERISIIEVESAREMYDVVMKQIRSCDIFLAVAAVSDYHCENIAAQKIHKNKKAIELVLAPNPDIVASVGQLKNKPFIVGFAAETEELIEQAKAKRNKKNMDIVIANKVGKNQGMETDENEVLVFTEDSVTQFAKQTKTKLAKKLIDLIANVYEKSKHE